MSTWLTAGPTIVTHWMVPITDDCGLVAARAAWWLHAEPRLNIRDTFV
jgi:hypothetical protein